MSELFNGTPIVSEPDNDHNMAFGKPSEKGSKVWSWTSFKAWVVSYLGTYGGTITKSHTFTEDGTVVNFFPEGYYLNAMLIENSMTGVLNVVQDPVIEDGVVTGNYMGTYGDVAPEKKILFQLNPAISGDKADVYYTGLTRADYYSVSRDLIVSSPDWAGGNLIVKCVFIKI